MASMEDRAAARRKAFKKGVDAEEARRKREDEAMMLRKQKKDEHMMKKRMALGDENSNPQLGGAPQQPLANSQMMEIFQKILGADQEQWFSATQQLRKALSVESSPPIQQVIDNHVVPRLVEFLHAEQRQDIQFEAAWALTNVASGTQEQTKAVVACGALPVFVRLLRSTSDDVCEQSVWALGNIAGDSVAYRDDVLNAGGLVPLLDILKKTDKTSMMRNATWCLSNLCRGKPAPTQAIVAQALPVLSQLTQSQDAEVAGDACWALSYCSDGSTDQVRAVITTGVLPRLIELLNHPSHTVQTPALRTVGNVVTCEEQETQAVIDAGVIGALLPLLSHAKAAIRKESCWTISNLTAGTPAQIEAVLAGGLMGPLVNLLKTGDYNIKKEACWAISNACHPGNPTHIEAIVTAGAIPPLCEMLTVKDGKTIAVALDALERMLKAGKACEPNPICLKIEEAGGLDAIEQLQDDCDHDVYSKAAAILETYFGAEEEGAEEDPATAAAAPVGGFNFGA